MAAAVETELLESRLSMEDLIKMQSLFLPSDSSDLPVSMQRAEFVKQAWSVIGHGSQEEYGHLFDSVDVSREGWVNWERLASYFLLGLSEKDEHVKTAAVPRWRPVRTLPIPHRDRLHSITHLPTARHYLTLSKDGTLTMWDERSLTLLRCHRLTNDSVRPKDLWATAMVLLPNVQKMAVSFTSKEICFYDLMSKDFTLQYKLHGLSYTPISLHYWYHPERPDQAVLSFGDVGGQVSGVCFRSALSSLFERLSVGGMHGSAIAISWAELQQGRHRCCYTITHSTHTGYWVRTVRFLGSLDALLSCSTSPNTSMVLGWRESESRPLRITTFNTEKGITDLDFHPGLNLIATAGVNNQVCLWNPYVITQPVGILRGHVTSVVAVQFMLGKRQLISFSKDKVLRVWDVVNQLCIQRIAGIFPKTQDCKTLLFFHEGRSRLFLSFNSALLILEAKKESGRRTLSHDSAVTCVLYNSHFRQVISSDASSTVTCWLMDTGQKVKQFPHCHANAEISTMALDTTQTRLFTAGTDGVVKVWDFNGHCHHSLNAGRGSAVEISQILVLKRSILVFGWERMITVFRMNCFSQYFVQPAEWKGGVQHRDDVLCAAFRPPQTLVTGSCDGEIIIWNNSTENALRKLNPDSRHGDPKSKSASTTSPRRPSVNSAAKQMCTFPCGEEDSESYGITRLAFLEGRKTVANSGGADLVSCGGSGVVRFWNSVNCRLVGEFVAHKDSGSIILTVDSSGRYLATADMDGGVKVWDIQEYCLKPSDTIANQTPVLLSSLRPHIDCVTHLQTCEHGDQCFLLSASADCSLALSYLLGPTVGIFGQETHWRLGGAGECPLEKENTVEGLDVLKSPLCSLKSSGNDHTTLHQEDHQDPKQLDTEQLHVLSDDSDLPGWGYEEGCGIQLSDYQLPPYVNNAHNISLGMYSELRLEELETVEELDKPELLTDPDVYFRESSTPTPPSPPPQTGKTGLKAPFDEKSLFPREVLEQVDRPLGARHSTQRLSGMKNYVRVISRSLGKPKASASGASKAQ